MGFKEKASPLETMCGSTTALLAGTSEQRWRAGFGAGAYRFNLLGAILRLGGAGFGPDHGRRRMHLFFLGQPFARHPPVAVAARLVFGVLDSLAQRRLQRVGLALGRNGLHPSLNSQFGNLQTFLCTENNAGVRVLAQYAGNPLHTLLGLHAQSLGNLHLSGGVLHFHGQPPLLVLVLAAQNSGWRTSDSIAFA